MDHYGIVYVARNDRHPPNVYKVGGTSRQVEDRLKELNRETSNLGEFRPKIIWPVNDWEGAEKLCHEALETYRFEKEYFQLHLKALWQKMNKVCSDHDFQVSTTYWNDNGSVFANHWPAELEDPEIQISPNKG